MYIQDKTNEELQQELIELRQDYNSLKELYDTENSLCKCVFDEILETNLKLTLAMQGGNMAWWEMDVPTGNVTFDKHKVEMLGYPSENFTHYKDFTALVHPKDLKRIMNVMKGHLDGSLAKYEAEYRILASSGEYIWFYDYGSVVKRDSDGAPLICSGFVFNISDRKKTELDMLKIIKAIEFTSDAIAIADSQGRHFYQNKALSDLFGYETAEETEAAGGGMARVKDQAIAKQMFKTILHGKSWSGELELVTKSGRVFPAYERADAIKDKEGKIIGVIGIITDITERKQNEETLAKSEYMLQTVLDNFPGVVFWKDTQSKYLGCNQSFASGAGLNSPGEIVGKTDLEMPWALIEANNYRKDDINVMEQGKERLHIIETQHQSDGKLIWFDTSKFPLRDSMGQIIGVVGVSNDISTLRKAEQTLKESEVKFRQIFDLSPIGIVLTGLDKKFLNCNQAFAKMLGYSTEEIVGLSVDEVTFSEDRLIGMSEMKALIEGEVETIHIRKRCVRKDKQILWADLTISLIRDNENDPLYYLTNIQDITKHKEIEEERDLIIAIIEQSSDFIGTSDMQGNLLYHNPAAKAILGMSADNSLLGMHIKDICATRFFDLVLNEGFSTAIREGKWHSEIALKHFAGHEIPVSVLLMVHKDKDGIPIYTSTVMRDITNIKLAEINLKEKNEKIEAQNEEYIQINNELAYQNQEKENRTVELSIVNMELEAQNNEIEKYSTELTNANKELALKNEEKEKQAADLVVANNELIFLASNLQLVHEKERVNLAHEIHDSLAQLLVALKMDIGMFKKKISKTNEAVNPEVIIAEMDQLMVQVDNANKSARSIMNGLRPEQLEVLGFVAAAEVHLSTFEQRHHIKCSFKNTVLDPIIHPDQALALFRILQESLNNIFKHAMATTVTVQLSNVADKLVMEISDNGKGFDVNKKGRPDSYGLIGMKERIKLLSGNLNISSKVGKGTTVKVEIHYGA
jgi:PAS domain S-box-containing protein